MEDVKVDFTVLLWNGSLTYRVSHIPCIGGSWNRGKDCETPCELWISLFAKAHILSLFPFLFSVFISIF